MHEQFLMKQKEEDIMADNRELVRNASLTVEAAIVMPVFLFCILVFLYFLQIITVQEHIQNAITKTGLSLARAAYVYEDFTGGEDFATIDFSLFGEEYELDLSEAAEVITGELVVKALLKKELDLPQINNSCIQGGFREISFYNSRVLEEDFIDIVVRYHIKFPIWLFGLENLRMIQRVRLRGWTGHQVPATYTIIKEGTSEGETLVYITATGTVYHSDRNCSHLNISIEEVHTLPENRRNKNGGKYYPCELCCGKEVSSWSNRGVYYITEDGDRFHILRECSGLKRTVREVPLSEVSGRAPCKRCGKGKN